MLAWRQWPVSLQPRHSREAALCPLLCRHTLLSLPFCKEFWNGSRPDCPRERGAAGKVEPMLALFWEPSISTLLPEAQEHLVSRASRPGYHPCSHSAQRASEGQWVHTVFASHSCTSLPPALCLSWGWQSLTVRTPDSSISAFLCRQISEAEGGWLQFCHTDYVDGLYVESRKMSRGDGRQGEVKGEKYSKGLSAAPLLTHRERIEYQRVLHAGKHLPKTHAACTHSHV